MASGSCARARASERRGNFRSRANFFRCSMLMTCALQLEMKNATERESLRQSATPRLCAGGSLERTMIMQRPRAPLKSDTIEIAIASKKRVKKKKTLPRKFSPDRLSQSRFSPARLCLFHCRGNYQSSFGCELRFRVKGIFSVFFFWLCNTFSSLIMISR